jgi:hypothetical protein
VSAHDVHWVAAEPLWKKTLHSGLDATAQTRQMRSPLLLRFASDTFMTDLAATLATKPPRLEAHVATKVSFRLPAPGETQPPAPTELKLFQAAHGHFHLVAASLTCRLPGLPDHELNRSAQEKVGFVLRRRDDDGTEWSWGKDPSAQGGKTWTQLSEDETTVLGANEDLLPLFPVLYTDLDRPRRIYVGLVPTSSGETFKAAGALSPLAPAGGSTGGPPADFRPAALQAKVTDPLRALANAPMTAPPEVTDAGKASAIAKAEADQLVQASRFLLVDFAELLVTDMSPIWDALNAQVRPSAGPEAAALYDALEGLSADSAATSSWREALIAAWNRDARLTLFGDASGSLPPALNLARSALTGDALDTLAEAWFNANPPPAEPGTRASATSIQGDETDPPQVPKLDARSQWHYVIRCTYQRPQCVAPRRDVTSDPTEVFQIGGFFDLDAPTRPIHISLPVDTGIADLRKLRKNVNFLISNQLRAQMNRVTSLKDAMNGNFADGETFDLGLICSFSIPIITICALLVLMIFISLLNIVFWWLPFLRICFPIGLKAKN